MAEFIIKKIESYVAPTCVVGDATAGNFRGRTFLSECGKTIIAPAKTKVGSTVVASKKFPTLLGGEDPRTRKTGPKVYVGDDCAMVSDWAF
jgi:hypothetical protein